MDFYNDNDPRAASWLNCLVLDGHLPAGEVDEQDIKVLAPQEVANWRRVHLFAGIGGWAYALELAGWPKDRPVWTGSCPCQPFSSAGKGKGEKDQRHLWPEMRRLISECRPPTIFGEQVASSAGRRWFTRVRHDLEAMGYAVGCADLCAASLASPHRRQRLYFVAIAKGGRRERRNGEAVHPAERQIEPDRLLPLGCVEDAASARRGRGQDVGRRKGRPASVGTGDDGILANADRSEWGSMSERWKFIADWENNKRAADASVIVILQ